MKKAVFLCSNALQFVFSCGKKNEALNNQDVILSEESNTSSTLLEGYKIPPQNLKVLKQLGFSGIPIEAFENYDALNNETFISYLLDGNIELNENELDLYLPLGKEIDNLTSREVSKISSSSKKYTVVYDAPFKVRDNDIIENQNKDISQAIDVAISNYNELNLGVTFERVSIPTSYEGYSKANITDARNKFVYSQNIRIGHEDFNNSKTTNKAIEERLVIRPRPMTFVCNPFGFVQIDLRTLN